MHFVYVLSWPWNDIYHLNFFYTRTHTHIPHNTHTPHIHHTYTTHTHTTNTNHTQTQTHTPHTHTHTHTHTRTPHTHTNKHTHKHTTHTHTNTHTHKHTHALLCSDWRWLIRAESFRCKFLKKKRKLIIEKQQRWNTWEEEQQDALGQIAEQVDKLQRN